MTRRALPFVIMALISLFALFSPATDAPLPFPGFDKIVHCALFAALAWTARRAGLSIVQVAVGLAIYAVASEILQGVLPINRDADAWDALTDLVGVAIGLWFAGRARR